MSDARTFTGDELVAMPVGTLIEVSKMQFHDPADTYLVLHVGPGSDGGHRHGGSGSSGEGMVAYGKQWHGVADWGLIRVLYIPGTMEDHAELAAQVSRVELAAQVARVEALAERLEGPTSSGEFSAVGHALAAEIRAALRPPVVDPR